MNEATLPPHFLPLLDSRDHPELILQELLQALGQALNADRCFLYVRNPAGNRGKIALNWRRDPSIPDAVEPGWKNDTDSLPQEDPLFAAALRLEPSIFIEDVETADPALLNREFEARTFGHRALIHAHIVHNEQLWGILQPSVFGQPRQWTDSDRALIESILPPLAPLVVRYVGEGEG
jgi:GAF domain-containing protein